ARSERRQGRRGRDGGCLPGVQGRVAAVHPGAGPGRRRGDEGHGHAGRARGAGAPGPRRGGSGDRRAHGVGPGRGAEGADGAGAGGARHGLSRRACRGARRGECREAPGARPGGPGRPRFWAAAPAARTDHPGAHAAQGRDRAQRRAGRGHGDPRRAHHAGPGARRDRPPHPGRGRGRGAGALGPAPAEGDGSAGAPGRSRPPRPPRRPGLRLGHPLGHGAPERPAGLEVRPWEERALAHARRVRAGERGAGRRAVLYAAGGDLRGAESRRMTRLWDKGEPLDDRVLRYTAGEDHLLDARLVPYDVRGSIAHAEMLQGAGLLTAEDLEAIRQGLETLAAEHAAGAWRIELADEDVHTALETRLTARIGEAGARLHLGRSRNDQVLTALRLYLKDELEALRAGALEVAEALDALAAREAETPLPGYTHLQPAMPSSAPLWAGGFASELRDDADGLAAARRRLDKNPLGSAAGYGVPLLPIDREATRASLGFAEV